MKVCSVDGCGKEARAVGLCVAHYARFKKYGDVTTVRGRWDGHVKVEKPCQNSECQNIVMKRRYCPACSQRFRRHGDHNAHKRGPTKPKRPKTRERQYKFDDSVLNSWSPQLAWLLGWAITDGCIETGRAPTVSWMLKDREPLEIIKALFKSDKPIEVIDKRIKKLGITRRYYRFRLSSHKITDKFISLGVTPRKTYTTRVPSTLPPELVWHFIRGVVEGDGCLTVRNGGKGYRPTHRALTLSIASGSKEFLEDIKSIVGSGGIRHVVSKLGSCYSFCISSNKACAMAEKMYKDSDGLRLSRKYEIWRGHLEYRVSLLTQAVLSP